jgi:hypothetical protein
MTTGVLSGGYKGWPPVLAAVTGGCREAHNWRTQGEVIFRTWLCATIPLDRWVTIEHADPQAEFAEELLVKAYLRDMWPGWYAGDVRLRLAVQPCLVCAEPEPEPHLLAVREPDGMLRPVEYDFHGAVLRIEARNQTVVYEITRYLGQRRWLGVWPD